MKANIWRRFVLKHMISNPCRRGPCTTNHVHRTEYVRSVSRTSFETKLPVVLVFSTWPMSLFLPKQGVRVECSCWVHRRNRTFEIIDFWVRHTAFLLRESLRVTWLWKYAINGFKGSYSSKAIYARKQKKLACAWFHGKKRRVESTIFQTWRTVKCSGIPSDVQTILVEDCTASHRRSSGAHWFNQVTVCFAERDEHPAPYQTHEDTEAMSWIEASFQLHIKEHVQLSAQIILRISFETYQTRNGLLD